MHVAGRWAGWGPLLGGEQMRARGWGGDREQSLFGGQGPPGRSAHSRIGSRLSVPRARCPVCCIGSPGHHAL